MAWPWLGLPYKQAEWAELCPAAQAASHLCHGVIHGWNNAAGKGSASSLISWSGSILVEELLGLQEFSLYFVWLLANQFS